MPDANLNVLDYAGLTYYHGKVQAEIDEQSSRIATRAAQTALDSTNREVALIRRAMDGQLMEIETDTTEAYSKTLPSGTIGVGVNMVGGKSRKVDQVLNFNGSSYSANGITLSFNNQTGVYSLTGSQIAANTPTSIPLGNINISKLVMGHVYYSPIIKINKLDEWSATDKLFLSDSYAAALSRYINFANSLVFTPIEVSNNMVATVYYYHRMPETHSISGSIDFRTYIVDMTSWFNVTATSQVTDAMKAEVESYLAAHPAFFGTAIISADCDAVVSQGWNKFDGILTLGNINHTTGAEESASSLYRSNYIRMDLSNDYYLFFPYSLGSKGVDMFFYDASKTLLSYVKKWSASLTGASLPSGTQYMRFVVNINDMGGTLDHTININVSQPDTSATPHNGQYLPYMSDSMSIPAGLREDYPMRSAGDAYDYLEFTKESDAWKAEHNGNVGTSNIGNLADWIYRSAKNCFDANISDMKLVSAKILSSKYTVVSSVPYSQWQDTPDKSIFTSSSEEHRIVVHDSSFTDLESFKSFIADVVVQYEKATETVTDVTSYFPEGFSPLLNAEAGGSLTFHQTETEFPVPNSTDYFVKTTPSAST